MAYDRAGTGQWMWLKAVGTQADPLGSDWRVADSHLLTRVWFSKHPRSIRGGDLLVYYAARHGAFVAIAEVVSDHVDEDLSEARWKWSMEVRPIVVLGLRDAPTIYESTIEPLRVRRQSHIRLKLEEFAGIRTLILDAAAVSTGQDATALAAQASSWHRDDALPRPCPRQ
ncbi:MAG TPA: hypothetical protein VIK04_16045 [Solirubrobacteraceae bacterium]